MQFWASTSNNSLSTCKPTVQKYRGAARSLKRTDTCVIDLKSVDGRSSKIIKTSSFGNGQDEGGMGTVREAAP
jgi:hypothetical protein